MRYLILFFLLVSYQVTLAQNEESRYYMGYAKELSGTRFNYHSPFPGVSDALLMRGRADFEPISWITEVVPESYKGKFVTFVWLYSMDTDPEPVPFILKVNGEEWFRFSSPLKSETGTRSIQGKRGAELSFHVTMLDINGDEMGFAILT